MGLIWTVDKTESEYDDTFPWQLEVKKLPADYSELKFEQFVKGSYELMFTDGTTLRIFAKEAVKNLNTNARVSGKWIEYLTPEMKPGPKSVKNSYYHRCKPGIFGETTTALRYAIPEVGGNRYHFEDEPGFQSMFGEKIKDGQPPKNRLKRLQGVSWLITFCHRIWLDGKKIGQVIFDLRGEHSIRITSHHMSITDTRRIANLKTR